MLNIKFSHYYPKLPENCGKAVLLDVFIQDRRDLSNIFTDYDTRYYDPDMGMDRYYPLPSGSLLILLFQAVDGTVFTTIRRNFSSKAKYYIENIGKEFKIVIGD